ncbi:MAG: universal stress protein [Flavobacteriaceae bacterium]|nr:universal stress protein [Flavobacteriaceae bacterium]
MKRILVPVDFSEEARCAAKVAAKIAKKTKSDIYLLHMLDLPEGIIDMTSVKDNSSQASIFFMKKVHERFDELIASPFFKGIKVIETVHFHKTFDGVIEESKKQDIDLIVMGSSGASGLKEIIVGSNTEKIVRHSNIPVLVIKKETDNFDIKNIVFASDYSVESKKKFQDVIDFVTIFKAKIHFLYINTAYRFDTTENIRKKIDKFINDFKLDEFDITIYNDTSVERGILNYSRSINADLIALNTHGRSGLSQLFNGSIGQELANHAIKPVLTFKI